VSGFEGGSYGTIGKGPTVLNGGEKESSQTQPYKNKTGRPTFPSSGSKDTRVNISAAGKAGHLLFHRKSKYFFPRTKYFPHTPAVHLDSPFEIAILARDHTIENLPQ